MKIVLFAVLIVGFIVITIMEINNPNSIPYYPAISFPVLFLLCPIVFVPMTKTE